MNPTPSTSQAPDPSLALDAFIEALDHRSLATLAECFCRASCLITADGTAVHGRQEITAVLGQLLARHTRIELNQLAISHVGEVALVTAIWTMRSDGPEGSEFNQQTEPTLVLRQVEGTWKIAILALWGARHIAERPKA